MFKKLFLLFLFLLPLTVSAQTYDKIGNLDYYVYQTRTVDILLYKVKYTFYAYEGIVSMTFIEDNFVKVNKALFMYAHAKGLGLDSCTPIDAIELYSIPVEILNSEKMTRWQAQNVKNDEIWGLYDPQVNESVDTIVISIHDKITTEALMAHEFSHYWYNHLCWDYPGGTESFAVEFQTYYVDSIMQNKR